MRWTYHLTGTEPCWRQSSEGTVLVLLLSLKDRLRMVKSGSDRCLSQAALKWRPLLLGTQKGYGYGHGLMRNEYITRTKKLIKKMKSYSCSRISISHIFALISTRTALNAASLYTTASSSTNLKWKWYYVLEMNYIIKAQIQ